MRIGSVPGQFTSSRGGVLLSSLSVGLALALLAGPGLAGIPPEQVELQKCQQTIGKEGEKFIKRRIQFVNNCLKRISIEVVTKADSGGDVSKTAKLCVKMFNRLTDAGMVQAKFDSKVLSKCGPLGVDDILGTGTPAVSEPLNAANIANWCGGFGGSGALTSFDNWYDCLLDAHKLLAETAVSVQYPRMLEWLRAVRQPMLETGLPEAPAAVFEVGEIIERFEGIAQDDVPIMQTGTRFPASGQTTVYRADKLGDPNAVVQDDGTVQAGASLRYVDNGDGTITDLNTGLMWEKKSDDEGLHDKDNDYASSDSASPTIWDWLDSVNVEGGDGFAGYSDWRIPNVRELLSIIDYERYLPAVDPVFNTDCTPGCPVTVCSCTGLDHGYFPSTTSALGADMTWAVSFASGYTWEGTKLATGHVRAVRSGERDAPKVECSVPEGALLCLVRRANGHTYLLLPQATWTESEATAVSLGGHLVTINHAAEHDWVYQNFSLPGDRALWIGLNDEAVEGTFVWVSGEPKTYTNWHSGEPNNREDEDYAVIENRPGYGGTWNDRANTTRSYYPVQAYGVVEIIP